MKDEKTGNLAPNWFEGERVPNNLSHEEIEVEDEDLSDGEDNGSGNGSSSESDEYDESDSE